MAAVAGVAVVVVVVVGGGGGGGVLVVVVVDAAVVVVAGGAGAACDDGASVGGGRWADWRAVGVAMAMEMEMEAWSGRKCGARIGWRRLFCCIYARRAARPFGGRLTSAGGAAVRRARCAGGGSGDGRRRRHVMGHVGGLSERARVGVGLAAPARRRAAGERTTHRPPRATPGSCDTITHGPRGDAPRRRREWVDVGGRRRAAAGVGGRRHRAGLMRMRVWTRAHPTTHPVGRGALPGVAAHAHAAPAEAVRGWIRETRRGRRPSTPAPLRAR